MRKVEFGYARIMIHIVVLCALTMHPDTCLPADAITIDILDYGIYKNQVERGDAAPKMSKRTASTINTILLSKTERIPAAIGVRFGFRYKIGGSREGASITVVARSTYPGLRELESDEVLYSGELVQQNKIGVSHFIGYVFEQNWELVPGKWNFQLFYEGTKLAERMFTVYMP